MSNILYTNTLYFSAGKACLTIPCTQEDINATTASQEAAFMTTEAIAIATTAGFSAPSEFPYTTKNTGEIEVGESIYYTCADYIKVIYKYVLRPEKTVRYITEVCYSRG